MESLRAWERLWVGSSICLVLGLFCSRSFVRTRHAAFDFKISALRLFRDVSPTTGLWGQNVREKCQIEQPRLWEIAPWVRRDWRLVIAGWDDGGHLPQLRELVRELGLDGDVSFPGALYGSAKAQALHQSDAFLLASHSEVLPMAVLEAWAHAKPVFMTAACNLSEGFAAGAAIEVDPQPVALADALAEHLGRPDLGEIGSRGRALVEQKFSWPSVAGRLAAVYAALRDGQGFPDDVRFD